MNKRASNGISIYNPFNESALVENIWLSLAEKDDNTNFFTSWIWIGTWLKTLPQDLDIEFIVHYVEGSPVCCYFLGKQSGVKHKLFYKKRAYLNSVGLEEYDNITIEYNNPLIDSSDNSNALEYIMKARVAEELIMPVTTFEPVEFKGYHCRSSYLPSYWIDLESIKNSSTQYLSLISKNKRNQIKRSIKEYEKNDAIQVEVASSKEQAFEMLSKLKALHQEEWTSRGKPGAFASEYFNKFHTTLIDENFASGNIQLIRVYTETEDIGYLYNFIYQGEVLFYQCGFKYKENNIYRPGLVSHYFSILENLKLNHTKYNFLVGSSQYKQSLSTHHDKLHVLTYAKKNIKSFVEYNLRALKEKRRERHE